jgi:F-type H+-transporting ATPase subunit a
VQVLQKLVPSAESGRGFSFPPINTILRWKDVTPGINKVVIISILSAVIGTVLFLVAASKDARKAPKGSRNLAEIIVEFIEKNIIMETMGKSGMGWTPFLLTMFIFIYLCNLPGIIPFIQMPATARMGVPAFMALLVWVVFNATGIKHQGLFGYFKNVLFPPGVPKALYVLVTPIELISTLVVRPFSLAVRLFANMLRLANPSTYPGRDSTILLNSNRHFAIRPAHFLDGLRDLGCVPTGVHFHGAYRGVHRWGSASRALSKKI